MKKKQLFINGYILYYSSEKVKIHILCLEKLAFDMSNTQIDLKQASKGVSKFLNINVVSISFQ